MIVNGTVVEQGAISPRDRGFTLGDGIFETIPLYDRKPFKLDKHLERMKDGAKIVGITLPFDEDMIKDGIQALSGRIDTDRAVARLTVTRGEGGRGYATQGCNRPTWVLTCDEYHAPQKALYDRGATLSIAYIPKSAKSPLHHIKSTSALERILVIDTAKQSGAFEAITLTTDGYISSGAGCNIFWVAGGELYTPSTKCAILPGVTRETVIGLSRQDGVKVTEGEFTIDALRGAEEIFVTNSVIEIMPVASVTDIFTSFQPGAITEGLTQKYSALVGAT